MATRQFLAVLALASGFVACSSATVEPTIRIDSQECTSSDSANWPGGTLSIEISNNTTTRAAIVMGTYSDGYGHDDLVAYGTDAQPRPDFVDALEIFEVAPESAKTVLFDHGPGTYFMVCMPDTNTMIALDDVAIEG